MASTELPAIRFACRETLPLRPEQIAEQMLDLRRWPEFRGYGILPGVARAEFLDRTPEIVGTRIQVVNSDGSRHVEQIVEWTMTRLHLQFGDFTPPLSRLAVRFDETWELARDGDACQVVRSFDLIPRSRWARPPLWVISRLLRRAVARHLRSIRDGAQRAR